MKFLNHNLFTGDITVNGTTTLSTATGITRPTGDNSTHLATTAFVKAQGYATSTALGDYVPLTRTLTINGITYDLSANRSWTIESAGYTSTLKHTVKAGVAITKGQAVYVTSADGTNMIVGLASNATEATSSKTMGLAETTVSANGFTNVITEGLLAGLDTSTAGAEGDPVWLGTNGNLIYGLANKPYAPAHLVFIGIVTRKNANNGEIFVKVQNGFELNEIHDVDLKTVVPVNGHILGFDGTLWVNKTIAGWLGYTPANASGTTNYLSKFTGTTTLGNSQIFDNGTNVGIGTPSPADKFSVADTAGTSISITTGQSAGSIGSPKFTDINFRGYLNTPMAMIRSWDESASTGDGYLTFWTNDFNGVNNFTEKLRITPLGTVGIGTTDISGGLHVNYSAANTLLLQRISDDSGPPEAIGRKARGTLNAKTGVTANDRLWFFAAAGYIGTEGVDGAWSANKVGMNFVASENWTSAAQGTHITWATTEIGQTTRTDKMILTGAGELGLGTSTPQVSLNGARGIVIHAANNNDAQLRLQNNNVGTAWTDGGIVSISNQQMYVWNYEASNLIFGTNNLERARFDTNGNFGINTVNPSYTLDVAGQARLNNGLTPGSGQALIVGGSGDITLTDGGSLFFGAYDYGGSTYIRGYDDGNYLYFYVNGTNSAYLRSDGLTVNGTIWTNSHGNSSQWNTAYGWGNHALAGYLTTETDTLATVTARGATTSTIVTFSGGNINNASVKLAGYNQRGGTGYHGFLEVTNTLGSATNSTKHFRLNDIGSLEVVNNAYTATILSLSDAGALSVPSSVTAGSLIKSGGTSSQFLKADGSVDSSTYATTTYVTTQINNLINGAPGALDTLDELAAALGDDANFATSVTNSIATKVPQTRTLTINGTAYDLSADRSWTITAGVSSVNAGTGVSVNSTTGAVTVSIGQSVATSAQVTFDSVITNNNGNGTNVRIGDDAWLGDINIANTIRIQGAQNSNDAYIVFGSGDATALGRAGTGALTYGGNTVYHSGNLTNLNQLSNGPGYITSYTETDTLATVTSRGNATNASIIVQGGQGAAETTDGFGLVIRGNYTNGQYNHRLSKFDKGGGVPLYVQSTSGTANVWSNSARFGTYSGNGYEFEVYGSAKTNGDFVSTGQINASGGNSSQWNAAYGWGNHASAGYLTSYTETDTLATVTARGASTSTTLNLNGRVNIGNGLARPNALTSDSVAHARIGGADVHLYVASLEAAGGYRVAVQAARTSDFASFGLDLQSNGGTLFYGGNEIATRVWVQAQGYITGYTETDTLATVTARGASTSTAVNFGANGGAVNLTGLGSHISFKDQDNTWTGYVGFDGNTGRLDFPGRNVRIVSGYNGTIELNTGVSGYNSGRIHIPQGYLSVDNNYVAATAFHGQSIKVGTVGSTPTVEYGIFHHSGVGLGIASGAGGSTQGISFWSHNGSSFFESVRIAGTSGNVGIGTTNPGKKLSVFLGDISINSGYGVWFNDSDDANWRIGRNIITESGNYLSSNTLQFIAANASGQGWQFVDDDSTTRFEIEASTGQAYLNTGSLTFGPSGVIKKKITGVGDNPVKTASGVLASRSDNGAGYTYYVIETNVPQDDYQMGGFTIELFGNYSSTNAKTKIDLGGYWNTEANGGFIGFEAHGTNPQYKPTIEVARNSAGKTAFIIYGASWNYPVIVARDLWLGYSQTDGGSYGEGWSITGTNDVSSYTNKDTVVWRNAYSDSNPSGFITSSALSGYATESYVSTTVSNLVDSAPGALDTLNELAAALGDDANFATTVTNSISGKVSKSGDTMTGNLTTTGLTVGNGVATGRQPYGPLANANIVLNSSTSDSSGVCGIEFLSGNNYPSDGATIYFQNNAGGTGERAKLTLRVENDQEDFIELRAGKVVINANTYSAGGQDPAVIFQHNDSQIASISSGGQINASGGNSSQWNTAYNWGNHANFGYLTSLPAHNHDGVYLPINPDGDGPAWSYADNNPTINGKYVGGGQRFGADGDNLTGGFLQARHLNAYDGHVNSTDGYFVGTLEYGSLNSTHTTTQVINASGVFVGPSVSTPGDVSFSGNLKYGSTSVIYNSSTDVYANIRVLSSQSTLNDGMYINYNSAGGGAAHLRFFANSTNERMRIDAGSGYVGIGTTNPLQKLHLESGNMSVTGGYSIYFNGPEDANWRIGRNIISETGNNLSSNTLQFIAANASGQGWQFVDDDGNTRFEVEANTGKAYFNTGDLTVAGTVFENSSLRYKENIVDLESATEKVEKLHPVRYNKIGGVEEEIGLIAEEVAEVYPEVVTYNKEGQPDGVNYTRLSVVLLKAVQELTERINKLENK